MITRITGGIFLILLGADSFGFLNVNVQILGAFALVAGVAWIMGE